MASENKTDVFSYKVTTGSPPEAQAGSCADDHVTLCFTAGAHPPSIATSKAAGTAHRGRCTLDAGASGSNMIETRVECGTSMFPLDLRKGHGRRVEDPFFLHLTRSWSVLPGVGSSRPAL